MLICSQVILRFSWQALKSWQLFVLEPRWRALLRPCFLPSAGGLPTCTTATGGVCAMTVRGGCAVTAQGRCAMTARGRCWPLAPHCLLRRLTRRWTFSLTLAGLATDSYHAVGMSEVSGRAEAGWPSCTCVFWSLCSERVVGSGDCISQKKKK